jgi:hypothetical protein
MPPHALTAHAPLYRRKVIGSAQTLERLAERLVSDEPPVRGGVPQIRIPLTRDRASLYDGRVGSAQGFLDDLEARERGRAWSRSGREHIGGFPNRTKRLSGFMPDRSTGWIDNGHHECDRDAEGDQGQEKVFEPPEAATACPIR